MLQMVHWWCTYADDFLSKMASNMLIREYTIFILTFSVVGPRAVVQTCEGVRELSIPVKIPVPVENWLVLVIVRQECRFVVCRRQLWRWAVPHRKAGEIPRNIWPPRSVCLASGINDWPETSGWAVKSMIWGAGKPHRCTESRRPGPISLDFGVIPRKMTMQSIHRQFLCDLSKLDRFICKNLLGCIFWCDFVLFYGTFSWKIQKVQKAPKSKSSYTRWSSIRGSST